MKRRTFLQTAALAAGASAFGVPAFSQDRSPSEKLQIAHIGVGGMQGAFHLGGTATENRIALCDVDSAVLEKAAAPIPDAKRYADWRVMLDELGDKIDAVVISTPDHTHAVAASAAMKRGIHCYCEKPLAHDVHQIRALQKLARDKRLKTQMGTQIHAGENYRRVVEKIQAGAIGEVKEVHVRVGTVWGGKPATQDNVECPPTLNWDLWLGPAPVRPFQPCYLGGNWRSFWHFGNGGMGDMACHWVDLPFWALNLQYPKTIEASCPHTLDADFCPRDLTVKYEFDVQGRTIPLTWYDGAASSPAFAENGYKKPGNVTLFVGTEGALWSDYGAHGLLPEEKFANYQAPAVSIPKSLGHHAEWIDAIKNDKPTTCNFDYSGRLAETVLLGPTAYRCGGKIVWDAEKVCAVDAPQAEQYLNQPYREGWSL